MNDADILIYIGYLLGCWSSGYVVGFKIQTIKKFFDAI